MSDPMNAPVAGGFLAVVIELYGVDIVADVLHVDAAQVAAWLETGPPLWTYIRISEFEDKVERSSKDVRQA